MRSPRPEAGWLGALAGVLWASAAALAQAPTPNVTLAPTLVPLEAVAPQVRDQVRKVIEQPTLSAHAPAEAFGGSPSIYHWLLDHPDRAGAAWRRLGTPCLEITDRGNGRFGWADDQGSDLYWDTVLDTPEMRIWYAEGRARPGVLLPPVGVHAVVVLRHWLAPDENGRMVLNQRADLYFKTDSKTAALVARLMGPSAPRLTEQCVVQLQYFFSALTRYLDRHPERAEPLLFGPRVAGG